MKICILFLSLIFSFTSTELLGNMDDTSTLSRCAVGKPMATEGKHNSNQSLEHKYYVSVSNVTYSEKDNSLQMITRFFIDDFEAVLSAREDRDISLSTMDDISSQKFLIGKYIQSHLRTKADGELSTPNYLGAEIESDQIVLYIEYPVAKKPQTIEMRFTAFFELFEDQKNMVHVKINDVRKTLLMHINKKKDFVKF